MNNPFLQEFLKRKAAAELASRKPVPSTTAIPGPKIHSVRGFAESKPTAKQVENFFRERIERLNKKLEMEEEDSD
jgi:hypothetical protein